jgi:Flp pilus assembly protein TadD
MRMRKQGTRAHGRPDQPGKTLRIALSFAGGWVFLFAFPFLPSSLGHPRRGNLASEQEEAFQRGLAALKENRLQDSLEALTAAERERPTDARVHNFRGIVLARLGKNEEAAVEYGEAIRLDARLEDAYRNLGFLEWTEHHPERARQMLETAVKLSPDDSFAHYYLGRAQLDARAYSEAFRELELSRVTWPADPDFLMEAASGYISLGREQEGGKTLDRLASMKLAASQSVQVTKLLVAVHQTGKAVDVLKSLSSGQKARMWVSFDLALAYLFDGNFKKAVDQAHSCLDIRQTADTRLTRLAPVWSLIGIAEARLGQDDQAIDAFHKASALEPDQEEHWLNLTRELMERKLYTDAVSSAQDALRSLPNSYALHLRLGAAYLAAGHYPEAEATFRELVAAGDPLPTSYVGLAQVLLRTGRAEEAVTELAAGEKQLGASFLISYFMGLALDRAAKPNEALFAFREAVRLSPNSADAHLGLGKMKLKLERTHDAVMELETVLRLDPGNPQARRLLSHAYGRLGDSQRAAKYASTEHAPPAAPEGDLLGDFLVPEWEIPEEGESN